MLQPRSPLAQLAAPALLALLLCGCPARPPVAEVLRDRCPAATGTQARLAEGWFVTAGGPGWLVCRTGQVRYRGVSGTPLPGRLVAAPGGDLVAFVEHRGARCELLVLQEGDGSPVDPLRFPIPSCETRWGPHWVDLSTITIGPSLMEPKVRIRLHRD